MLSEESKSFLMRALAERDRAAIAQVPKTDLHCHALLSAPLEAYEQLLGRAVTPPPRRFELL